MGVFCFLDGFAKKKKKGGGAGAPQFVPTDTDVFFTRNEGKGERGERDTRLYRCTKTDRNKLPSHFAPDGGATAWVF